MMGNRRTFAAATVGGAVLVTVLSGCAGGTTVSPASSGSTAPTTSAAANSATTAAPGTFTDAQVQQLCSDMEAELQNWRTVTPTLGKGGLNIVVGSWATANGINLLDLAQHRDRVDTAMAASCPQVRDGALYALEIPDLASGMVGF
ncbi:hypothetical protein B2J88_28060 [Rhodococcus sp. SRB_17]|uniref:hypothetical protein n=1 Tax=Rhodococcus sp. OK302 TaxID=1882769 RepID=UPI000B9F8F70|nr:hypothetical protein [Rhodococcus sp. OK302]NMM88168.1 hypothetical protein [Rhodococcus sp. SRB_17]OYD70934.1 hypothetical protein BDB13_4577 [Rhodococcus sp. OK302]